MVTTGAIRQPRCPRRPEWVQLLRHHHDFLGSAAERSDEFHVHPAGRCRRRRHGGVEQNASNAAGRIPNFEKNSFRGPTQLRDVDFRIGRDIILFRERYKLQVFIEAFNLFNHTIYTSVNTSAYAYIAPGGAGCASTNPCLSPQTSFLTPTASSNSLISARQLQISGKFFF
jgi:hypothetical protein